VGAFAKDGLSFVALFGFVSVLPIESGDLVLQLAFCTVEVVQHRLDCVFRGQPEPWTLVKKRNVGQAAVLQTRRAGGWGIHYDCAAPAAVESLLRGRHRTVDFAP
jgi:hypothetical protein